MTKKNLLSQEGVCIMLSLLDLKEVFRGWYDEFAAPKNGEPIPPERYFTAQEAAERLSVDTSTLWRWNKTGYLKNVKVGNRVLYRGSDIENLLNQ